VSAVVALHRRPTCPVCAATASRTIVDLPYDDEPVAGYLDAFYGGRARIEAVVGARYVLERCLGCGLAFQRWVPDDALLDELYGRWIDHGAPELAVSAKGFEARRHYAFQIIDLVRHLGRPPSEIRVLDFGMGWGNWVEMAQAFGCRAEGTELGVHQAAHASARGLRTVPADELPDRAYDFVNTEQVFEHLVDPVAVGTRLARSLRPGGILRISVPNGSDIEQRLRAPDWSAPKGSPRSLNAAAPLEHLNTFDHESLVALGRRIGLRPTSIRLRAHLDQWEPIRGLVGAQVRTVRPARGTMLLFEAA
jgi:SAM-dependent methyltransferase